MGNDSIVPKYPKATPNPPTLPTSFGDEINANIAS